MLHGTSIAYPSSSALPCNNLGSPTDTGSLVYLLDRLRNRAHHPIVDLPTLPPRARCLGVEFIEFAMDDQAAPPFERLFAALGFCRAGEHVSKAVTRWRQGDINIVVNLEKEGFAHSYYITHGTGVCAIGLRVDNAAAALDRAQLLFDTPFHQAVGPGGWRFPPYAAWAAA